MIDGFDDIHRMATDTRHRLEQMEAESHAAADAVRESFNGNACAFPENWCNYASCVLGLRLARVLERGDIDLCRWTDAKTAFGAHYWLRIGCLDIDITADQFGDDFPAVFVESGSEAHANRFPDPTIQPLLARRPCTEPFERALLELDLALSVQTKRMNAVISVQRTCQSCTEASDGR